MDRFDVAVIGGGLVGCAAAHYLVKAGARVVVLEKGEINREASGRNAGSLHFQLEYRLVKYGTELAEQFAQVMPLTLIAIDDWRGLEDELQAPLEIEMDGGLVVAESQADLDFLEQRRALQQRFGLDTSVLSAKEVRRRAPYLSGNVIGAGYCASEGHANPRLVTLAFAAGAARHGAQIRTRHDVTAIDKAGSGWHIAVTDEARQPTTLRADKILNAAGAWSVDIAAMVHLHLPVYAVPLQMNVIERCDKLIPHLVQHASERLTVKQVRDGNILVGGGWPGRFAMTNARIDIDRPAEVVVENALDNLALAARLVPALRQLHLLRTWTGTTGVTPDQVPLLGEVPEAPGFYVATAGAAFTLGPTYARLISELMLDGQPSQSIDLYSPARFSHINNFMAARAE